MSETTKSTHEKGTVFSKQKIMWQCYFDKNMVLYCLFTIFVYFTQKKNIFLFSIFRSIKVEEKNIYKCGPRIKTMPWLNEYLWFTIKRTLGENCVPGRPKSDLERFCLQFSWNSDHDGEYKLFPLLLLWVFWWGDKKHVQQQQQQQQQRQQNEETQHLCTKETPLRSTELTPNNRYAPQDR